MTKPIFLLYDERMSHHRPLTDRFIIVETPERILSLKKRLEELNLCLIQRKRKTKELTLMNQQPCDAVGLKLKPQQQVLLVEKSLENDFLIPLICHPAPKEAILLVHSEEYYDSLKQSADATDEKLLQMALCDKDGDMYYNNNTFQAATLACGGVICCVNSVLTSMSSAVEVSKRAIAVVRPPGHHACQQHAMGTLQLQPYLLCSFLS
jgi:acetoin utilization deacetylase AcuC-like enzyme